MYDHIGLKVKNLDASVRFYTAALAPLGYVLSSRDDSGAGFGPKGEPALWLYAHQGPAAAGAHIAFRAPDHAAIKKFHNEGVRAAVRDFGAVHRRLVPGFVLDARLDGDARIVTFANGNVARELLVDCDDARRRLVYAVVSERVKQHSASVQVLADGDTRARLIWIVDVLPHEIAPYMDSQMDQAALAMQKALGRSAA